MSAAGVVPSHRLTDAERDGGVLGAATLSWARAALEEHGVAVLENMVEAGQCAEVHGLWSDAWATLREHAEPLVAMYDGRFNGVVPRFAELAPRGARRMGMSTFVAPECVRDCALLRQLMTDDALLGPGATRFCEDTIVSLPGAEEQVIHVDAGHLFDPRSHGVLPAHHFSCFVALSDQTNASGNTAFALGSHRTHAGGHESKAARFAGSDNPIAMACCADPGGMPPPAAFVDALLAAGSCVVFDSRLYHRGRGNRSAAPRPIYGLMWGKEWFHAPSYYAAGRSLLAERAAGARAVLGWRERMAQDGCGDDEFLRCAAFVTQHAAQLEALGLPAALYEALWRKLRPHSGAPPAAEEAKAAAGEGGSEPPPPPPPPPGAPQPPLLDAGAVMQIGVCDEGTGVHATAALGELGDCFLVDHAWSFAGGEPAAARAMAADARIAPLVASCVWPAGRQLGGGGECGDGGSSGGGGSDGIDGLRACAQTYHVAMRAGATPTAVHFLPDIIGCNLREAPLQGGDRPNACLSAALIDVETGAAYSLLWLVRDVAEGEQLLLPHGTLSPMLAEYRRTAAAAE